MIVMNKKKHIKQLYKYLRLLMESLRGNNFLEAIFIVLSDYEKKSMDFGLRFTEACMNISLDKLNLSSSLMSL